jgi:hypothetical protein
MGRFRENVFVVEKRYYILRVCVCSLLSGMQSACAVIYCHCGMSGSTVWICHILPHYLINSTIFGKNVIYRKMCVLIISRNIF